MNKRHFLSNRSAGQEDSHALFSQVAIRLYGAGCFAALNKGAIIASAVVRLSSFQSAIPIAIGTEVLTSPKPFCIFRLPNG